MKIAMIGSEAAPFAKSGGLGDVLQGLPAELARIPGNEVCLFLPLYRKIRKNPAFSLELVKEFTVTLSWRQQYTALYRLVDDALGYRVYFIDNEYYFGRDGLYGFLDDGERYAYFGRAVLDAMVCLDFIPQVIQSNDWQTAMVPVFLKAFYKERFPETKTLFTIHNIEYQGWAKNSGR